MSHEGLKPVAFQPDCASDAIGDRLIKLSFKPPKVADGVANQDMALWPTNLGLNVFRFRVLRDFNKQIRVGMTWVPISHSIPEGVASGLNEFVEYFPLGSSEATHHPKPFVAAGLAHAASFSGSPTFNIQGGFTVGSHFDEAHTHDARIVVGYYTGTDPRSKYSEFLGGTSKFTYLGLMFNL